MDAEWKWSLSHGVRSAVFFDRPNGKTIQESVDHASIFPGLYKPQNSLILRHPARFVYEIYDTAKPQVTLRAKPNVENLVFKSSVT